MTHWMLRVLRRGAFGCRMLLRALLRHLLRYHLLRHLLRYHLLRHLLGHWLRHPARG